MTETAIALDLGHAYGGHNTYLPWKISVWIFSRVSLSRLLVNPAAASQRCCASWLA